jgi:hypothetical protein
MKSKLQLIFLIFLIPLFFFSCKQDSPVPEVYVSFYVELNNPTYYALNSVGGSVEVADQGYKGIILIQTDYGQFAAYDATCTYDPEEDWGKVVPDKSGVFASDTVCGSRFVLLYGGYPDSGPASIALKMYVADYNSTLNRLYVHN